MLISDLNHFEEIVAEAPSVIGGNTKITLEQYDKALADDLKKLGLDSLVSTTLSVSSNSSGSTSVETATGQKQGNEVKLTRATSVAGNQ